MGWKVNPWFPYQHLSGTASTSLTMHSYYPLPLCTKHLMALPKTMISPTMKEKESRNRELPQARPAWISHTILNWKCTTLVSLYPGQNPESPYLSALWEYPAQRERRASVWLLNITFFSAPKVRTYRIAWINKHGNKWLSALNPCEKWNEHKNTLWFIFRKEH